MSNTLMIHLGTPKTGTSALQKFLADNAEKLKEKGWCYPDLEKDWATINLRKDYNLAKNGGLIKFSLAEKWPEWEKDVLWKIIYNYLKHYNVILSDEGLWSYPGLDFSDIINELRNRYENVKIICYFRRQDLYIESKWNQDVKAGFYDGSVLEYFEIKKEEFDYKQRLGQLSKLFGRENVIVRVYEKGQFGGERRDITSDFLDACKIDNTWEEIKFPGHVNERIDSDVLGLKHLFNKKYSEETAKIGIQSDSQVSIGKCFLDMKLNESSSKLGYISTELRKTFMDKYEADNAYIAREYLGRNNGTLFYEQECDIPLYVPTFSEREEKIIHMFAKMVAGQEKKCQNLEKKLNAITTVNKVPKEVRGFIRRVLIVGTFRKLKFK